MNLIYPVFNFSFFSGSDATTIRFFIKSIINGSGVFASGDGFVNILHLIEL